MEVSSAKKGNIIPGGAFRYPSSHNIERAGLRGCTIDDEQPSKVTRHTSSTQRGRQRKWLKSRHECPSAPGGNPSV